MMKLLTTLRNNWKKSVLGFCVFTYGTNYLIERKHLSDLLQAYCYEALKYSQERVSPEQTVRRVTVFINPVANSERGRFLYDKNVAPLLHLAGLDVRVVRLDRNSEANAYMKEIDMNDTDCVVVAGGNATLNEVISGLLHRPDAGEFLQRVTIGVIPIGQTNSFANKWFDNFTSLSSKESELRLLADSGLSIVRGISKPADLVRVTLKQQQQQKQPEVAKTTTTDTDPKVNLTNIDVDSQKRGAYSLLKENQIYALSNVSCGFVTETDANKDKYWQYWFYREHMNRYFMDRFLRRNPIRFHLTYKNKCNGCSRCLNEKSLVEQLNNLNRPNQGGSAAQQEQTEGERHFLKLIYKKLIKGRIQPKETPAAIAKRERQRKIYERLIAKSKLVNTDCNQTHEANLIQTQLIANINEPDPEAPAPSPETIYESNDESGIATVLVRDPEFNVKSMFLADKRYLKEFEIKKLASPAKFIEENAIDQFALDVDGEIYKLDNRPETDLSVRVEYLEKCINLLTHDPKTSQAIKSNREANLYLWKRANKDRGHHEGGPLDVDSLPKLQPFERLYLDYWNEKPV